MPKVLLVFDIEGWAWHRRAKSLAKYSPPDIHVTVIPQRDFTPDMPSKYDGTLVFSWPDSPVVSDKVWTFVANEGLMYPYSPHAENYVHRTASKIKNRETAAKRIPRFRGVITINHRTVDFLTGLNPNTHLLRTGVDCDVFKPLSCVRTDPPFRIGWCGKAFDDHAKWTPKGFHEILLPLMQLFQGDDRIEWVINRRDSTNALSETEMVEWYNSIDLMLVTSCSEGTPSSLMEAWACARSTMSTNVGIADETIRLLCKDLGKLAHPDASEFCLNWHDNESIRAVVDEFEMLVDEFVGLYSAFPEWTYNNTNGRREVMLKHYNWKTLAEQWLNLILS